MSPALLEGYAPIVESLTDQEITRASQEPASVSFFASGSVTFRASTARINLQVLQTYDEQKQFIPVVQRLVRLLELKPNWDSYGARAIASQAAQRAVALLGIAASVGAPAPQIVPTSSGGLQLEWHQASVDLELEVHPSLEVYASYERYDTGESWSAEVTNQARRLVTALEQLTHPTP